MMRSFLMMLLFIGPALAAEPAPPAEPTFSRAEVETAYALGHSDAIREQIASSPAAKSLNQKMASRPSQKNDNAAELARAERRGPGQIAPHDGM